MIYKICTRICTQNARFHMVSGIFLFVHRVQKSPTICRAKHCTPAQLRGFRNNVCAKIVIFQNIFRNPERIFFTQLIIGTRFKYNNIATTNNPI